jgi:hypothetical protein
LLFVVAYVLVRLLHLKLYADAARRGRARRASISGFTVTASIARDTAGRPCPRALPPP